MSFITDPIQSALTPSGTNARKKQEQDQGEISKEYQALFDLIKPLIEEQVGSARSLEPQRQAALKRLLALSSPGNNQGRIDAYTNGVFENAIRAMKSQNAIDQSSGLQRSFSAGRGLAASNMAADSANKFARQINSPEAMMQMAQMQSGAITQGQSVPGLGALQAAGSGVYGRPQVQVQPGVGGQLGALAGMIPGLGGGGGGSVTQFDSDWARRNG